MSHIADAVSLVLTCGEEVFVIQRQNHLRAFPGYWAFPGGKVDAGESLLEAAERELKEEIGFSLRGHEVSKLGVAESPDFNPLRFSTHFFRVHLKEKVEFTVDANEARHALWMRPADFLAKYNSGDALVVPPILKVMEELQKSFASTDIGPLNRQYNPSETLPYIESLKSVRQIMPLSHTIAPATRTNAFLIGELLIDPSPWDEPEYAKFRTTISPFKVTAIMITHHHPDHHERSNRLARELGVPMLMSAYTKMRLERNEPSYFDGLEVRLIREGDVVTKWLGRDVLVYEVPGHDEGQLAVAPEDMSWFLAGDLFQGVGTVVIGGEEGDMKKYFDTLEKVIALAPKVLYPSHGIGLGGTGILETTLAHRRVRENQILQIYLDGKTTDEMLEMIYAGVDRKLWPYAKKNISKHLDKLKAEGKI